MKVLQFLRRSLGVACGATALLFGFAPVDTVAADSSSFSLVDNFDGGTGPLNGRFAIWFSNGGELVADPANAANQVALIGGSGERGSHVPAVIPNNQTGTLFFRFRVDSDNADFGAPTLNYSIGMADVAISGDGAFGDYEVQLNQNRDDGNFFPEEIRARHAGAFVGVAPLQPEAWYKVWLVINNTADTTQIYMEGGQFAERTQLETIDGVREFTFRNSGGGPAANDLTRFFVRVAGSHAGSLYFDDIWIDPSNANLSDPTDNPAPVLPPVFADLAPAPGATFFMASNGLSFRVTSAAPGGVATGGIKVVLNGEDITSQLTISGTAPDRLVQFNGLEEDVTYIAVITARDAGGREREATIQFDTRNHYVLPAGFALPVDAAQATAPGFTARVSQVIDVELANTEQRAESQLAGTLIDPLTLEPYWEATVPGENPDDTFNQEIINWNINAGFGTELGSFQAPDHPDESVPGVVSGYVENVVAEVLAYLELPSGLHTLGVNSDDGFVVWAGVNQRDLFRVPLGRFDGGRAATDSLFTFNVRTPGLYPVRLLWYQGGGDAALEFFSVNPESEKILINDRSNPNAIRAWRAVTVPVRPYISAIDPGVNQGQVATDANISITIQEPGAKIETNTVALTVNGQAVSPAITRGATSTTVAYAPANDFGPLSTNTVVLTYNDGTALRSLTNQFVTLRTRPIFSGFQLVDDFAGAPLGPLDGRFGEWLATGAEIYVDPVASNNRAAGFVGGTGDRAASIEATIPEGQSGTVFFRMMVGSNNSDDSTSVLNWSIGMSDVALTGVGGFGDYEVQLNMNRDSGTNLANEVRSRDGGAFISLTPLQPQTWYKVWMEIDNLSESYQVYAQGGQFATRTLLESVDGLNQFAFRNFAAENLVRFFVRISGAHAGELYFDDIWVDSDSINSADPIAFQPEPPADVAVAVVRSGANIDISWPAAGTEAYVLERTESLSAPNWQPVATEPATVDDQKTVSDPIAATGTRFYRLRQP